jgi:hypothetical protein
MRTTEQSFDEWLEMLCAVFDFRAEVVGEQVSLCVPGANSRAYRGAREIK